MRVNAKELEKIVTRHETQCLETACAFKKPVANVKIVSGGQTGVDRGALESLKIEFRQTPYDLVTRR